MMDLDGYLGLALPLVAACAARPLSERLPPRTATWLLTATAVVMAVAGIATLAVLALGGALRLPAIAALGHLSQRVLRHDVQTGPAVGTVAGAMLVASLAAAGYAALRQVRGLLAAARTTRALPGDDLVAVVDDPAAEAFALPGRPGRVVVSTGMLSILTAAERRALLAHERAHLTGRHHLFRALTGIVTAANPMLWPLRGAVAYTTERWADERAAATVDDRVQTARAIGKAALAHNDRPRLAHHAALGIGTTGRRPAGPWPRAGRPGPLPRRVAALLAPPPHGRPGLVTVTVVLVALSVLAVQDGAADLHELIEHAQARPASAPVQR
ncbi:M56 family metallopeptidase [Actinomadura scrupuli]|uniref:M56 family metallopeptidase n=1 Tax=Actinomadura scrupuli TaxID=559629 RepID=UPI003D979956